VSALVFQEQSGVTSTSRRLAINSAEVLTFRAFIPFFYEAIESHETFFNVLFTAYRFFSHCSCWRSNSAAMLWSYGWSRKATCRNF
jgi:hypothetical protein